MADKLIAVGSTNPVKVKAVTRAVQSYWNDISIISISTESQVSDMPMSKVETRIGAKTRALNSRKEADAWIGVGNEGGVCWIEGDLYLFSTTYATDGQTGSFGGETLIRLNEEITQRFGDGNIELGQIMDEITGKNNVKQKEGAVGYLTNNVITRTDIFELSTKMALAHWLDK